MIYLRGLEEAISVAWVDRLCGIVPSSMVGIPSVSTCVHLRLLNFLNLLVSQPLLDLEELPRSGCISGVSCGTNSVIPSWFLSAEEVTVDGKFDIVDDASGALMIWIRVLLIPPVEAGLITGVIELTVMN